jgi:energy-coupling factor transporter ATP-binding protein EcfA2
VQKLQHPVRVRRDEESMSDSLISIKQLSFRYRDQEDRDALTNINLDIKNGEFIVVMGASGAGKSTLCFTLNGLIPIQIKGSYSGSVSVKGVSTEGKKVSSFADKVGIVFQDFETQLFSTNVELEVAFGPENFAVEREEIGRRIAESLDMVGLEGFNDREPSTLSGGQKQRLAIASVLAIQPDIICMDEPTTDLDPIGKNGVFLIAKRLRDKNMTMIIAEHETEETLYADKIIILDEGKIVETGTPREILTQVDFLRQKGIMPLQTTEFFKDRLPASDLPLEVDEAIDAWNLLGLRIHEEEYQELIHEDKRRLESHGDVLIEVKDLEHTYPTGLTALRNANLKIRKGEFLAVVGQNGSGKTTLVKHLNGLLLPTKGSVIVNGKDTREQSLLDISRSVGYVFQNPDHQIFEETVAAEVAFGPRLQGQTEEEIERNVKQALEAVDLVGYEEYDPFSMSKGERQRIAVASIVATKPSVIIMDEPTTGLDYPQIKSMMELIKALNEAGHTIIMVTHTMWVVAEYAHRAVVLRDGEIILQGTPREIFRHEDILEEAFLKPPQIIQMGNRLGKTVLSVAELESVTEEGADK